MVSEKEGKWSAPFELGNVAVHACLLPNSKVLYWGRRANPREDPTAQNLNQKSTAAFVWDPATKTDTSAGSIIQVKEPLDKKGSPVNLFCSGHALLPDGTLLIAGGHVEDGQGLNQASVYNPLSNAFEPKVTMYNGRWYPSVITLPDGRALVVSGSFSTGYEAWVEATDPVSQLGQNVGQVEPLYPRLHITPKGRIITVGPQSKTWFFDVKDDRGFDIETPVTITAPGAKQKSVVGRWSDTGTERASKFRDYAPSVMYPTRDKTMFVMYMGGGIDKNDQAPTDAVELLNLNESPLKWTTARSMMFKRRQFNATILPDGTVLVTGGTNGPGFNDWTKPVQTPELWDHAANEWRPLAKESFPRCYHSVALLLPSGQVLSAGGGEYGDVKKEQCITAAQLYDPPYLCKGGSRPTIVEAPLDIKYGDSFIIKISIAVAGGSSNIIKTVSWMRLGSVTHCRNMGQSLLFLDFTQDGAKVSVSAPANSNLAPPGLYMLFVLDPRGVPSVARIIHISSTPETKKADGNAGVAPRPAVRMMEAAAIPKPRTTQLTLAEHSERLRADQGRPPIVVGLTPTCPYGLGPCWGGAFDALRRIHDVEVVSPMPDQADSVAFVYPKDWELLPDIDAWRRELAQTINSSYELRGIEMTLSGHAKQKQGELTLSVSGTRPRMLVLAPFTQASQVKWDNKTKSRRRITDSEAAAHRRLQDKLMGRAKGASVQLQVTGTLQKRGTGEFALDVRDFKLLESVAAASVE